MNLISCILPYLEKHWNNWLKHLLLLTGTKLLPRCESGCIYLFSKITCMCTSSLTCPEQFFRAIWEAVSGGYAPQYVPKQNWNSQLSVQFSHLVMSDPLQPHGLQHARLPCPSPTSRVYLNSCPLSWWCHPTISSCHPLLLPPSIFPSIRVFSSWVSSLNQVAKVLEFQL